MLRTASPMVGAARFSLKPPDIGRRRSSRSGWRGGPIVAAWTHRRRELVAQGQTRNSGVRATA